MKRAIMVCAIGVLILASTAVFIREKATPGSQAYVFLDFVNNGPTDVTLQSTVIIGKSGIPITFTGPIVVPATGLSSIVVTGFAVNAGVAGNIPQLDITKLCCAAHIYVQNDTDKIGGIGSTRGCRHVHWMC